VRNAIVLLLSVQCVKRHRYEPCKVREDILRKVIDIAYDDLFFRSRSHVLVAEKRCRETIHDDVVREL
jgi:hypothetical protein